MASLQARGTLRNARPVVLINKLVSLAAFIVLLCAGWLAVSYLKAELPARTSSDINHNAVPVSTIKTNSPARAEQKTIPDVRRLPTPVRLVYSCKGAGDYYHLSTHLPARCERNSLSEGAAFQLGLKPCPICIP